MTIDAKRRIAVALAAAMALALALPVPSAAAEPSAFGYFHAICLDTDGRDAPATSKALELGFTVSQVELPTSGMKDLRAFEKIEEQRVLYFVIGRSSSGATADAPASYTRSCGVTVIGPDPASAVEAKAWAGAQGVQVDSVTRFGFRRTAAGRIPLSMDDRPAVRAAMEASEAGLLSVTETDMMTMFALTRGQPTP